MIAVSVGLILLAVARIFSAGKAEAKLDAAADQLKEAKRNAEINASIDSLSAAERRERLQRDWSDK